MKLDAQLKELNRLYKETDDMYHDISVGLGLSDSAMMILYGICQSAEPCTQRDICNQWSLKKQTINSAIGSLIKSGYLFTRPSDSDCRNKFIELTEQGRKLVEKTVLPLLEAEKNAFSCFTAGERELLLKLTAKHVGFLQAETKKLLSKHSPNAVGD